MEQLKLPNLLFTPTLLQLADRSVIKLDGVLEYISVSLDSWEYPMDFMILTPKNNLGGHPLISRRPWLAIADAFISFRSGDMYISNGSSTKKFTLYCLARAITEVGDNEWVNDEDVKQPIFTLFEVSEDIQILNTLENFETSSKYDHTQFQLDSDIEYLSSRQMSLHSVEEFGSSAVENFPDMANYLVTGKLPPHLFPSERRKIIHDSSRYSWISNELYKTGTDFVIKICVSEDEIPDILKACHHEPCDGHFADKRTTYKILSVGYYWMSLFKDAKQYFKRCDNCQRVGKPTPSNEMSLQT
eukprot:PITA_24336